jgi:pimeloyl-ACP methyl ester carboxylesterase
MLTRSHADWQPLAVRLAESGITALAIDFRGHGGSTGSRGPGGDAPDHALLVNDAQAALDFLAGRADVEGLRMGVGGASIGASVAIMLAAEDPRVRSVVLLSPASDYRGLRAVPPMRLYGDRPALMLAAPGDGYAVRSMRELAAAGNGLRQQHLVEVDGHGTVMLSRSTELVGLIVDWFRKTLI